MADNTSSLVRFAIKFKNLETLANVAYSTFAKGRMSLKSKKDLQVGQRITLSFSIPEHAAPIDIISEVIQQIPAQDGDAHTFAVRWLNFTEKKLVRLMASTPGWTPVEPASDPLPEPMRAQPPAAAVPPPFPPKPQAAPAPGLEDDEYVIDCDGDARGNYPSFMDRQSVIIPDAPESPPSD